MSIRFSRLATGILAVAAVVLLAGRGWAIYEGLDPSPDDWKLKYDVQVYAGDGNTLTVVFTLADEGRLKPIYSIDLLAFSKPGPDGGRTYDLKAPIVLKPTDDGKRSGQVQVRKDLAHRALFRVLTLTVDGQRRRFAAYYDIPLYKYLNKVQPAPPSIAAPPRSTVTE